MPTRKAEPSVVASTATHIMMILLAVTTSSMVSRYSRLTIVIHTSSALDTLAEVMRQALREGLLP